MLPNRHRVPTSIPILALVFALSLAGTSHAAADTGRALLAAHAACDGSVFAALAKDAPRWRREASFTRSGKLASFKVAQRSPREYAGQNADAALEFAKPININGLPLVGWFDADLSKWSRFADAGVGFVSWGFYIDASPADIRDALIRGAPAIGRRLRPSTAEKEGVFCLEEALQDGKWVGQTCAADDDFPRSPIPHRWLVIRPDGPDSERSVLSCELAGKLPPALIQQLRPDL